MQVPADLAVIVNIFASESEYWVDCSPVCRRGISVRQEHEGEPPAFDSFGHAGETVRRAGLCQTYLDVALHIGSASAAVLTLFGQIVVVRLPEPPKIRVFLSKSWWFAL
jgi:hypothetical protein